MSSSSGGDKRAGQSQATTKIKTSLTKSMASSPGFTIVGRNGKPIKNNPVSPNFRQINENPPILNTSSSEFNFNDVTDEIPNYNFTLVENQPNELSTVVSLSTDNTPSSPSISTDIDMSNNINNNNNNILLRSFSPDYNGPIIILAESTDQNKNMGNWHPISVAKFFSTNFVGITNIKPAGSKKVKITFNTIINANNCLISDIPRASGFHVNIPSNLIFSYGIIKLDNNISENEFFEGHCSSVPIAAFKRISIQKDGKIIQTRTVELKFVAPKLPSAISIYNMLFEVTPSIRSPVQCNRCLRFGHTQKYCRSDARCSHCGVSKHSIDSCPTAQATDPSCLYCKLPHLSTDRSCREWSLQKDIKKIMATENISYKDAAAIKKNKHYTSAFKYSDIVNSQPPISETMESDSPLHNVNFPILNDTHHFFNNKKKKYNSNLTQVNKKKIITLPPESSYTSPNGSYFNIPTYQTKLPVENVNDFSWIHTLSYKLSESLINAPSLSSPFSPSYLQNLIESSLTSLLAIPNSFTTAN